MSVTHTSRYALPAPNGDDPVINGDNVLRELTSLLDSIIVTIDSGTLAARPAAAISGRLYICTDQPGRIDIDTGSAWLSFGSHSPGTAPVGALADWAGASDPTDTSWLICNGRSLVRDTYPALFTALGGGSSPYGLPDGTHFNLPDFRGRVPVGVDGAHARGAEGGALTHALTVAELPAHHHRHLAADIGVTAGGGTGLLVPVRGSNANSYIESAGDVQDGAFNSPTFGDDTGGGGSHPIEQPYLAVNKIIRAI